MKPSTNILLTSLSRQGDRKSHRYFFFESNGTIRYCDGLSVAEAGTKYILADVDIDEIIVLGAGRTYDKGEELKRVVLKEWSDYTVKDTNDLSEYTFLQYRIAQFIDGLDMEAVDVLEDIDPERAKYITGVYDKFCAEINGDPEYRPDRVFHMIAQDEQLFNHLEEMLPDITNKELLWLERMIYTKFADNMKLSCLESNNDIEICFIPTSKDQTNNYVPAQNVSQIVNVINSIEAESINIYMDMQGLASTEGYTILAVLSMLSDDVNSRIHIREIITSHYRAGQFAGVIDNKEMKRYEINRLVSGMDAFIRYGKVDEVRSYWKSRGIENKHIDSLLAAMRRVDDGISLCNTGDLETGINYLKYVFQNTPKEDLPEVESNIFRILENTIRMDYGKLLEEENLDELELVRWAMRKGFYQQSLTIIESRIPRDIVESGMFYYAASEESKLKMLEEINKIYWDTAPKDRWAFDDMPHYFIKFYGRSQIRRNPNSTDRQRDFTQYRIASLENEADGILRSYSTMKDSANLLEDVLYNYYLLGDLRNKVNHAEVQPKKNFEEMDADVENENIRILREGIEKFVASYDAARAWLSENVTEKPDVWQITKEDIAEYVNNHKIDNRGFRGNNNRFGNRNNYSSQKKFEGKPGAEGTEKEQKDAVPAKSSQGGDGYRSGNYSRNRNSYSGGRNNYHRDNGGGNEQHYKVSGDRSLKIVIDIEK
ncbi:MAG: hypothetical protein IKE28_02770 [Solobacterium sp.]|nr:hypothetical protein [Solobacterium sp.]